MQISKKNTQLALKNLLFKLTQQISLKPSKLPVLQQTKINKVCIECCPPKCQPKIIDKMTKQLSIFYKNLIKTPEQWINLLINDGIQCETQTIIINNSSTITKLYSILIKDTQQDVKLKFSQQLQEDSYQDRYINQTSLALIAEIFNTYATIIVQYYTKEKQIIKQCVNKIDTKIRTNQIMNTYIVFSLLKQIAKYTQKNIKQNIRQIFSVYPFQKIQQFSKYIQNNYQFLNLGHVKSGENYIYDKKQNETYQIMQNQKWLNIIDNYKQNNLKLKKIQSLNGHSGYLIERQSFNQNNNQKDQQKKQEKGELQKKQRLILKVEQGNQIRVVNANVCQQSWRIFKTNDSIPELQKKLKEQIQLEYKKQKKQYVSYGVSTCQFATIGGSLGKCLANIDKYNNANEFLLDLSKSTAIYSTLSIALTQIPILSYFIIAGGFTYSFYMACSNEALSSFKKADIIGKATVTAVGSVSCTIGGIFLGQALIPVPFVGALVGGIFGGFFGAKGTNKFNQATSKRNFQKVIAYLKANLIDNRRWKYKKQLLDQIGLSQKYFNSNTAEDEHSKDTQITGICFCIATFHQSKRYSIYNQQKLKQHEQMKKQLQNQWHQYEIKVQKEQKPFVNQFNIVEIVDYLTQEKYNILENLDQLGNFIAHLVG